MTWRQFYLMREGWLRERHYKLEGARYISYTVASVNRDPKKSFPKLEEFMPLLHDDVQTKEEKEAELQETFNRITAKYKKHFPKSFTA